MRFQFFGIFLGLLIQTIIATGAIEATDKDFYGLINKPNTYSFVKFYASWCGHCKNLAPVWDELAEIYEKNDKIQIISIDGDKYSKIGRKFKIQGYPTLKLFEGNEISPKEYQGGRNLESFTKFIEYATGVKSNIKEEIDYLNYLNDDNYLESIDGKHGFLAITASWCGYCKKLKPEWKKLAQVFKNDNEDLIIGDIVTDEVLSDEIKDKFQIESFPTIVYLAPNKSIELFEKYQGERSLDVLVNWVNEKTNIHRLSSGKLSAYSGRIKELDENIQELLGNFNTELLEESKDILSNSIAPIYSKSYYEKLLNKIENGDLKFFEKEFKRLSGIVQKQQKGINEKLEEKLVKRLNILQNLADNENNVKDEL